MVSHYALVKWDMEKQQYKVVETKDSVDTVKGYYNKLDKATLHMAIINRDIKNSNSGRKSINK
jgi:hypothetical protein